jgi:hypothetical protein
MIRCVDGKTYFFVTEKSEEAQNPESVILESIIYAVHVTGILS